MVAIIRVISTTSKVVLFFVSWVVLTYEIILVI